MTIAGTADNRFVIAWAREIYTGEAWLEDVYYTIRRSDGALVKGVTKVTDGVAGGDAYRSPTLTAVTGSRALLAYESPDGIAYTVIDSAGGTIRAETPTGYWGSRPDAVELSDGDVVVASSGDIEFMVIDGSTYEVTHREWLPSPTGVSGYAYVSVAADQAGHAVLTWTQTDRYALSDLTYALVDGDGRVLTEPTIFRVGEGVAPSLYTSYDGFGNTSHTLTPPTAEGVDLWVTSALAGAPPGGTATIPASLGNHGAARATSVVLTATLDSRLGYTGVTPAPASVEGRTVVWTLLDLAYLGGGRVRVHAQVPSATIGSRYPVTWTLSSAGPEADPSDNRAVGEVMVARQVFLPLVLRGH